MLRLIENVKYFLQLILLSFSFFSMYSNLEQLNLYP